MSEDKIEELTRKIESATRAIPKVFALVRALLVGSFVMGAWVAAIEVRQQSGKDVIETVRKAVESNELRIRGSEQRAVAVDEKLSAIKETVQRIDRKIDP